MRESDAMRLGNESEPSAIAVEAPRTTVLDDFEAGFIVAVDELVSHFAGGGLVRQFERLRAEPLNVDDGDEGIRQQATHGGVRFEVLELHYTLPSAAQRVRVMPASLV